LLPGQQKRNLYKKREERKKKKKVEFLRRTLKVRKSVTSDNDQTDVFPDIQLVFYHLPLLSGKVRGFQDLLLLL